MNTDCLTDAEFARYFAAAVYQAECEESCVNVELCRKFLDRFIELDLRRDNAVAMLTGEDNV